MLRHSSYIVFSLGLALASCSTLDSFRQRNLPDAVPTIAKAPTQEELVPFNYKSYPKELLVQYEAKEAWARALETKKEKNLNSWDDEINHQYNNDIALVREQIFSTQMPAGIEIIRASPVVPQVTLRVHNKEAYDWLHTHPKIEGIWRTEDFNVRVFGSAIGTGKNN